MRIPPPQVRLSFRQRQSYGFVLPIALLLGFVLICVVANLPAGAQGQDPPINTSTTPPRDKKPDFVPGELLVRFRPNTAGAQVKGRMSMNVAMAGERSVRVEVNHFLASELVEGLMLARVPAEDTLAAIKALRARPDVLYAEPNYIRYFDVAPNDTRYSNQWALQAPSAGGINAESAWNTTTGSQTVVVGVIDSGIDIGHGDLKDNIFVNPGEIPNNSIDDDGNGFVDDVNGWDFINNDRTVFDNANDDSHGTHVAGTIGARGNNALGIAGVSWNVQLMSLKAIGSSGGTDTSILNAYTYAKLMRQRGVNLRVLNNSYGSQRFSQSMLDAIRELSDLGVLFVAAAGNETANNDVVAHFPASFDAPNIISVAASNNGFFASAFSNRGQQSVHLAAPGQAILSTTPRGYTGDGIVPSFTDPDGSTYSLFNGTSMASPHVAGVAALACAANPGISVQKLKAAVLNVDESGQYTNLVITGGHLNAAKAVQAAIENDVNAPAAPGNFRINSQNGRRVELAWTEAGDDGTSGRAALDEIRFTDSSSSEQFPVSAVRAVDSGTQRTIFVSIPWRHSAGQLSLRTIDNAGNSSTATVNVSVNPDVADPYTVSVGPATPLTALNSGTAVGPRGDDLTSAGQVSLPFPIPFFGFTTTEVIPSSNGALYIPIPPEFSVPRPNIGADDLAVATETNLENMAMVAGMWADLRTDVNPTDNVYMVRPDLDRVIFRWQAVRFGTNTPVNFEIELRRDGTILTRYGNGNQNLLPVVVGISGGDPDAYLVDSHSSNFAPLSLGNAQTVTFALRNPPPPPIADLAVTMTAAPNPVLSGQNVTYNVRVTNLGPSVAENLVMNNVLPAGTTFVSCTTSHFVFGTCTGPAVGSTGTVTGRIDSLQPAPFDSGINFTIVAKVTAAPGSSIQNTASASSFRGDPVPSNNTVSVTSAVVAETFFTGARAIAAGSSHTTSVRNDGTVWVWGAGSVGQLGNGNSGIDVRAMTPVQVSGLEGVDAVADSNGFVYALKSDGTVWGWGLNNNGQLGDGTTTDRSRPVQTVGLTNVKAIDGGDFYGAGVKTDGSVWLWGASNGLISNNFGINTTPVQLNGISNVATLAAGANHLLMLKTDKTVWALGSNSRGELGDGTTTARHSPVQVPGLANVARIAAGAELSVALKEDGTVWAWGNNRSGQLGPGGGPLDFDPNPNPVQVTGLPAVITYISAGPDFILAVANDGTVWSWGNNGNSQLGQGNQVVDNPVPKQIPNFGNVVVVAAGNNHSVALKSDGSVWCWGANSQGEVGDGSTTLRFAPNQVSGLETVSSPSLNPPGGRYTHALDVVITCATPGATIHYTLNGNEPTEADPMIASGGSVRITAFTFLRARAWKPGLVPSSPSFAQYDIDVLPPQLLLEENGPVANQTAAWDSVTLLRDPFPIVNVDNHLRNAVDPNTRVALLAANFELFQGETAAAVTVNLQDTIGIGHAVPAEDVRAVPNTSFKQIIFRLPNNLPAGTVIVSIRVHDLTSNVGTIRIKP